MYSSTEKSVGQILREKREQMGASLEEAAHSTLIKLNYLQELESDHPELLLSKAQARGFLRLYASYLQLPYEELIAYWDNPTIQIPLTEEKINIEKELTDTQPEITTVDIPTSSVEEASSKEDISHFEDRADGEELSTEEELQSDGDARKTSASIAFFENLKQRIQDIRNIKWLKSLAAKKTQLKPTTDQKDIPPVLPTNISSREIFVEIGTALRERRESMELTLSDIEKFTNIKRMYLIALEDGRFSDLPSTVQGRGMLNIYAQFLALDESAVMDQFASALQLQREELLAPQRKTAQPPLTVRLNLPPGLRRVINPDLLIGALFIIGLFAFILWGTTQMLEGAQESPTEAPSISDVLQITPTITPAIQETTVAEGEMVNGEQPMDNGLLPGVESVPAQPTPIATINAAPLQLYIIAHDRAYLRILVDDVELFNGRVLPNNVYTYSGQELIELLTGNGAALEVYFNQKYLGDLGGLGEVVDLRFSLDGLVSPIPQPDITTDEEDIQSE